MQRQMPQPPVHRFLGLNVPTAVQFVLLAALLGLAGCATRPVNPPLERADPTAGYR
jgi:hypothetical protein